jgi:hypothetical protein
MEKIHPLYLARLSTRLKFIFSTTVAFSCQLSDFPNINALGGAHI